MLAGLTSSFSLVLQRCFPRALQGHARLSSEIALCLVYQLLESFLVLHEKRVLAVSSDRCAGERDHELEQEEYDHHHHVVDLVLGEHLT